MADEIKVKGKAGFFKAIGKAFKNRRKKSERESARTTRKVEPTKSGGSAFDSAANLKSSTKQPGAASSRTPTQTAAVKARRMKAKRDAASRKAFDLANGKTAKLKAAELKKIAKEKAEALKKAVAKKAKDTGKKVDSALTSKKLKAEKAALAANKRKSAKKEKKDQKNPFADTKKGTKLFKDATGAKFKKERLARLNRNKKAGDKLDDKIKKSVGTRKKIIGGTAAGITGIGGAVALSGSGDKKSTTSTSTKSKPTSRTATAKDVMDSVDKSRVQMQGLLKKPVRTSLGCLLYTSPSPRD